MKKSILYITLLAYIITMLSVPVTLAASELGETVSPPFYAYRRFGTNVGLAVYESGGTVEHSSDGGGKARFLVESGSASNGYADLSVPAMSSVDEYIIEAEVTPISVATGSYIELFDAKDTSAGRFRIGARFTPDGKIYMHDASVSKVEVGAWSSGNTVRMSMHYRISEGLVDVYIDGVCVGENISCVSDLNPTIFRIDMAKSSTSAAAGRLEFYVDNIRIYGGSQLLPAEGEGEYTVYSSRSLDGFTDLRPGSDQGGTIEYKELEGGNGVGHFYVYEPDVSTSFFDTTVPVISGVDEYITEVTVTPNRITGGYIRIFDAKDGNGSWRIGSRFNSNNTITIRDGSGNDIKVGTWTAGVPVRYSVHYNIPLGLCDVYINGELVKAGVSCSSAIRPHIFRIDLAKPSAAGDLDFYVDDIHLYSGYEIKDNSEFPDITPSVMDDSMIPHIIGTASVFTIDAKYYFAGGKKKEYSSDAQRSTMINGAAHISKEACTQILGMTEAQFLASEGRVSQNGIDYISAETAAGVLGKCCLYDERGFFVISDTEFKYVNSDHFISLFETSDLIYRYMMFDNPTGMEFLADFDANISAGEHPRILYNAEELAYIKAQTRDEWQLAKQRAIEGAISSINTYDGRFTADCTDDNKQSQATNFQSVIHNLATAYLLTGEETYAQKGVEYMNILAQWETLGFEVANLTTGHWAMGMAIGYDSFYNYMTQEQRDLFKAAIKRLPFADTIRAYSGGGGVHWITIRDNFMGVIGGGMMALILAVADEEDLRDDVSYIAENLIKSLEIAISLYYPNGGYFEGVGYSEYMLGNLCMAIEAMFKCCNTDYGFEYAKGFTDAGHFFAYMQTTKARLNFSDCARGFSATYLPLWFGYRYGKTDTARLWYYINQIKGTNWGVSATYYLDKGIGFESGYEHMPLDAYYPNAEAGTFRNSFNTANPVFAGFHGGRNGLTHDMLDLGQFVFESDGIMWVLDLGGDSYSLPSYFGTDGYKIYRKNPEGENCVLINPAQNMDENGKMLYYGQKLKANAPLTLYETAPRAAMAAYDLSDAYERDVDAYTRGYYFGDNRNTLQVQDEIKLKATSELYWFMHTDQTIEIIDNNTARIKSPSASLRVEVYCEGGTHELKVMDAVPLPTSPTVEGQSANSGITKLAVYMPAASGDVQISVKLIPENDFYVQTPVTTGKIAEWTLPDGQIEYPAAVADARVSDTNIFNARIQIPDNAQKIKLYIDDEYVKDIDIPTERISFIPDVDFSDYDNGSHTVRIDVAKADGSTESAYSRFEYIKNSEILLYQNTLANFKAAEPHTGWTLNINGNGTRDYENGSGLTVISPGGGQIWLDYRANSNAYAMKNKIVAVSIDVEFSSSIGHFEIECKGSTTGWYMADQRIFKEGKMINGEEYKTGQKYNVMLLLNLIEHSGALYIDGKLAKSYPGLSAAVDNILYKFQYSNGPKGATISYSNLKTVVYSPITGDVDVSINLCGNEATAAAITEDYTAPVTLMMGYYKDNKLVGADICTNAIPADTLSMEYSTNIPDDCEYIKAFVFDKESGVKPLGRLYYYKK